MDLEALRAKSPRFIIGLMTGTSCDGVDAVLVRIKGTGPQLAMKLVAYENIPYEDNLRLRLLNEHMSVKDVCLLNFEVGEKLAEAVLLMKEKAAAEDIAVDFVASHGQTVAHFPPPANMPSGTLQIGEPAVIAERTGLPVVSDFRSRDMAAGGQGAPLVPYADWLLWRSKKEDRTVACLNIGGIANFTVVTPDFNDIIAFDTGPGNMAIDGAVRLLTRGKQNYDDGGKSAAKGVIIDEFMEYLLDHPYFEKDIPKSTGREEFGDEAYLRDAIAARRNDYSDEDLIATVTAAVSQSIVDAYERYIRPQYDVQHLVVGGGGAMNKTLMRGIKDGLAGLPVFKSDQFGIPHGAREAICFAILGNETICNTPANVPQATGARHPCILGKITPV